MDEINACINIPILASMFAYVHTERHASIHQKTHTYAPRHLGATLQRPDSLGTSSPSHTLGRKIKFAIADSSFIMAESSFHNRILFILLLHPLLHQKGFINNKRGFSRN